jgi:cytochrome oxidase assembly protein ShyY1
MQHGNFLMSDQPSKADSPVAFKYLRWLLALLGVPLLFGLGYWQLQRAEQKQIWLDQQAVEPMTRAATALRQLERQAWVPVRLEVELLPYRIFLLDNRTLNGRVGYEVIVPMRVDEGSLWLASLGWVEAPSHRDRLPALQLEQQRIQVDGVLAHPTGSMTLADLPAEVGWPRRIQSVDLEQIRQALEMEVEAVMLHLKTPMSDQITPRSAMHQGVSPQRHQGYAVQWFALAITLLLWLFWAARHGRRQGDGK